MKIQVLKEIFSNEVLTKAHEIEKRARESQEGNYCDSFKRFGVHNHWFFLHLHHTSILKLAKELFGRDIKPSYSYLSMYCSDDSICPKHVDRPQCKYSIDVCLKQNEPWAIYVMGKKFLLAENEALIYSGTDHFHWRDRIKPGNRVSMVFFHFVDSDFAGPLD